MTHVSPHPLAAQLVETAIRSGADEADALIAAGTALDVSVRKAETESIERSESLQAGLRVIIGGRQASVGMSDVTDEAARTELVERAVAMARVTPEDPHAGLPEVGSRPTDPVAVPLSDAAIPTTETLGEWAAAAEEAALAVPGITNTEGGHAGAADTTLTLSASDGFDAAYRRTHHSLSVSVVAGTGTGMERDYDYSSAVRQADLTNPAEVGRRAGARTVARLEPRKAPSAQVPVVFEPRVASGMLSLLARAISGTAVARGTTFLKDRMGSRLFPQGISITDDPLRPFGHRSRPFDGEGVAVASRLVVDDGVLRTWLLDSRSARKLELASTGSAARAPGGVPEPGPSNLFLAGGAVTPDELLSDIRNGFYVTEMLGMSFNLVTGDYSRGATGYWIENGEKTHPVSEVTVAGNLADMFLNVTPADDLTFRTGIDSPTIRIDGMTVAGI
ncbi:MAG: TldD/PmbA family protein [Rhodospirillales bacterium]|nr:TldD/PmbA family protein [Rhodospirillales bacterium]